MKLGLLIFGLSFLNNYSAQEWQTVYSEDFSCDCGFTSNPGYAYKLFKINPYTNDLWMGKGNGINVLTNTGNFIEYNYENMNIPPQTYGFLDFAFTSDAVYSSRFFEGFYRFKDNFWTQFLDNYHASSITEDHDTIIITGVGENYYKYYFDSLTEFAFNNVRRSANKNGIFWGSPSDATMSISKIENNQCTYYYADTSILLSNYNYNFKFSKKTDSLFVASDLGLSIAYGNMFIDSIDVNSSINMPINPSIMEFEFDHQDNIWALFGTDLDELNGIGFYNQTNRTWEQFYDGNNSPIDFTQMLTIEVDTAGNLWVAERDFLHVLKINNPPTWLETQKIEKENSLTIYPNPSITNFKIDVSKIKGDFVVEIVNVFGEKITEYKNQAEIKHNLAEGIYFVKVKTEDGFAYSQKLIVAE